MILKDFNKYLSYHHFLQYIDVSHEDKFINILIFNLFHKLNPTDQNNMIMWSADQIYLTNDLVNSGPLRLGSAIQRTSF